MTKYSAIVPTAFVFAFAGQPPQTANFTTRSPILSNQLPASQSRKTSPDSFSRKQAEKMFIAQHSSARGEVVSSPVTLCNDVQIFITNQYLDAIIQAFVRDHIRADGLQPDYAIQNSRTFRKARQELTNYLKVFPTLNKAMLSWLRSRMNLTRAKSRAYEQYVQEFFIERRRVRAATANRRDRRSLDRTGLDTARMKAHELVMAEERCLSHLKLLVEFHPEIFEF